MEKIKKIKEIMDLQKYNNAISFLNSDELLILVNSFKK